VYDFEFVLDEEGEDPIAVVFAEVLLEHIVIAGRPFFGGVDIPVLFDGWVVEEGRQSCVVLAACVDVLS